MKFRIEFLYSTLSSTVRFREDQYSVSHILLIGANEFLTYVPHFLIDFGQTRYRRHD